METAIGLSIIIQGANQKDPFALEEDAADVLAGSFGVHARKINITYCKTVARKSVARSHLLARIREIGNRFFKTN